MKHRKLVLAFWFLLGYFMHILVDNLFGSTVPKAELSRKFETNQGPSKLLIIFVLSSVKNQERRQAIRETWAKNSDSRVSTFFAINCENLDVESHLLISREQQDYNDLVLFSGIEDSFHSLTLTVLSSMLWATGMQHNLPAKSNATTAKSFDNFSFFMKCDDDSYVRVDLILQELTNTYRDHDMLYWGFFDGRARVKRTGKYKELGWNICDTYLPYALGGGYILARKPVEFIASNAKYWRLYQNEDTSVGAWLSSLEGLERVHDPRFDTEYLSRGCHQSYLVTHKHNAQTLHKIHNQLTTTGFLCSKEYRTRLSYKYDWTAIPSKCCQRSNPAIP